MEPTVVPEPTFRRPQRITGPRLLFRDAAIDDAQFILSLRLDPAKNRFISRTAPDLQDQVDWLRGYVQDRSQAYFVIEDQSGTPVGTVRLYDAQGASFCWGSWILSDGAPKSSAIESTLMVYTYGLACGFQSSHFDVRKANDRVWSYHEWLGARRTGEDAENYYYTMSNEAILGVLDRWRDRIPGGVRVEWKD